MIAVCFKSLHAASLNSSTSTGTAVLGISFTASGLELAIIPHVAYLIVSPGLDCDPVLKSVCGALDYTLANISNPRSQRLKHLPLGRAPHPVSAFPNAPLRFGRRFLMNSEPLSCITP